MHPCSEQKIKISEINCYLSTSVVLLKTYKPLDSIWLNYIPSSISLYKVCPRRRSRSIFFLHLDGTFPPSVLFIFSSCLIPDILTLLTIQLLFFCCTYQDFYSRPIEISTKVLASLSWEEGILLSSFFVSFILFASRKESYRSCS